MREVYSFRRKKNIILWGKEDRNTYLMYDGFYYKIGQAYEPEKRLKSLRIASPNITLICYGKKINECHLHKLFSHKRVEGEWFDLDKNDVSCIKRLITKGIRKITDLTVPYVEERNLKTWYKQKRIIEQYKRLSDFIKYRPEVYELVKNKRWFEWEYGEKHRKILAKNKKP
jgi:hypothetical protein